MENLLLVLQIILSSAISVLILVQSKGSGLGRTFGGGSVSFSRRGVEKAVFRSTFVTASLFLIVSILGLAF